jgi:hypothetical protein
LTTRKHERLANCDLPSVENATIKKKGENILDNQGVEVGERVHHGHGGRLEVLLLVCTGDGVLVAENEVDLVGTSTLVGSKHDGIFQDVDKRSAIERLVHCDPDLLW